MLNVVVLQGRLGNDPELRTTPNGTEVANVTIAVDRSAKGKDGEKVTDWIKVVAWQSTARFLSTYFKKGSMIALTGSIQTRNYEDNNGNKRTAFEVVATEVSFCGSKNDTNPGQNQAPTPMSGPASDDFEEIGADDYDDSLPF